MKPPMSDAELKRRKKLQGKIAVTTSTLGLASLGLKGGSIAAGRMARGAKAAAKVADAKDPFGPAKFRPIALKAEKHHRVSEKLNSAAINTGIVSSGIGGVGGYNFAAYTKAESRKRGPQKPHVPVAKNYGGTMDFGLSNVVQGDSRRFEEISKRQYTQREENKIQDAGSVGGLAGGLGAFGAYEGTRGVAAGRQGYKLMRSVKQPRGESLKLAARFARAGTKGGTFNGRVGSAAAGLIAGNIAGASLMERKINNGTLKKVKREELGKAYDPEANRIKRLDHWETAAKVGAGAAGAGAVMLGTKAAPGVRKLVKVKTHQKTLKTAGAAAGLGLTSAGLVVGADRIKSYKKKGGQRYRPLH